MYPKNMVIGGVTFGLVVIGLFVLVYLGQRDVHRDEEPVMNDGMMTEDPYGITRIDAKHFYIDGTHTLAGEIVMPTPCDLLDSEILIAESYPEQVMINFNVINTADSCTQVITPQRFKVSFEAAEAASIAARFMGKQVELNLIPAAEGETPDEFELFIKG